ncbi:Allantoinase [Emydomyces testavorans]|uniref:allantoinase n=1 Tax=Emydomyces testavorans TaxID=2070801 RepID=A0AAF0DMQ5_9EURO|nr:Allantoinase [Emydomyces testavorans]
MESAESDLIILCSSRAFISGHLTPATLVISRTTGKITAVHHSILPQSSFDSNTPYTDLSPYILLPGLVDTHVHLNQPGRTEWEGFYTGTQAAASGGVTTVIDMPLNSIPPTTSVEGLEEKIKAAEGQVWVDVGLYGGVVPENVGKDELKKLVGRGVRGFKGFLIDSGVKEFPAITASDIEKAMVELADEPTTLMFHAEMMATPKNSSTPGPPTGPSTSYSTYLSTRPPVFETSAIEQILSLSHLAPNLPLHIVHLSAIQGIPLLRDARKQGVKITAETCFHYLSMAAENIPDRDTRHKCAPPIREQANQDELWTELLRHESDGVIKTVVSDHSPCTPDLKLVPKDIPCSGGSTSQGTNHDPKLGDFLAAWGGISSLGLGFPILWTELNRRYPNSSASPSGESLLKHVVQLGCVNTAAQVGLQDRKGDLAVGYDADICVFDDETEWTVEVDTMFFRNKCSPYQEKKLKGMVKETWLRGRRVFSRDEGFGDGKPQGKLLLEQRLR